jgi:hypothetical protein
MHVLLFLIPVLLLLLQQICISSEITTRPLWGAKEERMHLENLSYILSLTGNCMKKYSEAKTKLLLG